MEEIRIRKAPGIWVVRSDDAILAETRNALEFDEPGSPPVIFIPYADVAMALLDPSDATATSSFGEMRQYSLVAASGTVADVAWSFDPPSETAAQVANHLAFRSGKVAVERL